MFSFLLVFNLLTFCVQIQNSDVINCLGYQSCDGESLNCAANESCTINCGTVDNAGTTDSCLGATMNCPNGFGCTIHCYQYRACQSAIINGNNASYLTVRTDNTSGTQQIRESVINCPNNGDCTVQCRPKWQSCHQTTINAEDSNSLEIHANGFYQIGHDPFVVDSTVYCPTGGTCTIDSNPTLKNIENINIYAENGFDSLNIIGEYSNVSIGTIHCESDYTSSCAVDRLSPNMCGIKEDDKSCNAPTAAPTTATPTTAEPTTQPTAEPTDNPTTDEPTHDPTAPTTDPTWGSTSEAEYETEFEIEIDPGDEDLSEDEIEQLVIDALEGDDGILDVSVVSIETNDEGVVEITVIITSSEDINEKEVEDILEEEIDEDIDIEVAEKKEKNEKKNENFAENPLIISLIVTFCVLCAIVCGLLLLIGKRRRKKSRMSGMGSMSTSNTNASSIFDGMAQIYCKSNPSKEMVKIKNESANIGSDVYEMEDPLTVNQSFPTSTLQEEDSVPSKESVEEMFETVRTPREPPVMNDNKDSNSLIYDNTPGDVSPGNGPTVPNVSSLTTSGEGPITDEGPKDVYDENVLPKDDDQVDVEDLYGNDNNDDSEDLYENDDVQDLDV